MKKLFAILLSVFMLTVFLPACDSKENFEENQWSTTDVSDEATSDTKEKTTTANTSDSQTTAPDTSDTGTVDGNSDKDWTLNY